jgi:hypothetical protein
VILFLLLFTMASAALHGATNLRQLEGLAQRVIEDPSAFGYFRSGSDDEATLRDNELAFQRWQLRPRMLVDVSAVRMQTTLLGHVLSSPVLLAPMAAQRMAHDDGELATARAAAAAGIGFCLSTLSTRSIEEVAAVRSAPPQFFQLYVFRTRAVTEALVRRAEKAGYAGIIVTVDAPYLGRREADERSKFQLRSGVQFANLAPYVGKVPQTTVADADGSGIASFFVNQIDATLTWSIVAWLKGITKLPIILKGILTPDDALLAVRSGANALCVSNHGGRQLDSVPAAIDALPGIVAAVRGRVPIIMDGGVRRGTDVLKALALGATAVLVGRPMIWALALGGQAGVAAALQLLHQELRLAVALSGLSSLPPPRSLVQHAPWVSSRL